MRHQTHRTSLFPACWLWPIVAAGVSVLIGHVRLDFEGNLQEILKKIAASERYFIVRIISVANQCIGILLRGKFKIAGMSRLHWTHVTARC